ncbi:hypothetical protein ACS0TY_011992 [Phlomoides rotata]
MEKEAPNSHCLILPFPIQGHINPMIQFSKRLSSKGVRITIAATKNLLRTTHDFPTGSVFVDAISDGFDYGRSPDVSLEAYLDIFRRVGAESLSHLLDELKNKGFPVDCVIYDPFLPWGLVVAKKLGILAAPFFTQSSSVNVIYYSICKGQLKVPILEKEILVAGLPALEISDVPSFVRDPTSHPGSFELTLSQFQNVEDADFVFVNSFYELEEEATDWLAKFLPVKTIGPTIPSMYLDKRLMEDKHYGLSIFKADDTCMKWLEERAAGSVIYVSFGSMAKLEEEQMVELALSIKMSNKYFLWVVRSSEESKLPTNFAKDISEKGLIVSWCPQLEVLAHDAIGCFITHCGWNSTLEAFSLGVPLVGIPWWSDQSTNAKFVMDVWKTGIRACPDNKNIVRHEEIGRCVKLVMEGERGEGIRKNVRKWKELARGAVDEGGSSDRNIREFISTINMAGALRSK